MVYIGETVNLAYFGVPVLVGEIGWIFMVWLYMRKGVEEMERRREGEVGGEIGNPKSGKIQSPILLLLI